MADEDPVFIVWDFVSIPLRTFLENCSHENDEIIMIDEWCELNLGPIDINWRRLWGILWEFKYEHDYVLFKLTWE